jgi:hypothetical protein
MRGKRRSKAWNEATRQYGQMIGEQIAMAMLATTAGPGQQCEDRSCPDYYKHLQSRIDAAEAMRVATAIGEGRYPAYEPKPACSALTAALAKMEAAGR